MNIDVKYCTLLYNTDNIRQYTTIHDNNIQYMTILDINIAKGIVITKYMTIYVTIHYNTKRILSYIVSIVTNCHVLSCIVNNIARVWFADVTVTD